MPPRPEPRWWASWAPPPTPPSANAWKRPATTAPRSSWTWSRWQDVVARAKAAEEMGASYIGIHIAIDEQMQGKTPWDTLREVAQAVSIPVAVAGGINSETAPLAIEAGASIVIVGGAITKAVDATAATQDHQAGHRDPGPGGIGVLRAGHRPRRPRQADPGLGRQRVRRPSPQRRHPRACGRWRPGSKLVGPALTVRTYPGRLGEAGGSHRPRAAR